MPWIAIHEGEKKGAFQVPKQTDVECPTCGARMRVWGESSDGRARHFKHIGEMGQGEGGGGEVCESVAESDKHIKWKNLAAERLSEEFSENVRECGVEMELDAPVSEKDRRIGDAVLLFEERDEQLGRGVVVEVQHRNESKDIRSTTADYISQDLSIVWTDESDYGKDRCRLAEVNFRNYARDKVWPELVPEANQWWEPELNHRSHQPKWQSAVRSGLGKFGAPATLPPDWCDEAALRIWNEQQWDDLFSTPTSEHIDATELEYQSEAYIAEVQDSLATPIIEIQMGRMFTESDVREWYNRGLELRDDTKKRLPSPAVWSEVHELQFENSTPDIPVRMPPEFFEQHRDELQLRWRYGAGKVDVDVARPIKSNNASRSCAVCSDPADYYLFKADVVSEFRCTECALDLVESDAQLDG